MADKREPEKDKGKKNQEFTKEGNAREREEKPASQEALAKMEKKVRRPGSVKGREKRKNIRKVFPGEKKRRKKGPARLKSQEKGPERCGGDVSYMGGEKKRKKGPPS